MMRSHGIMILLLAAVVLFVSASPVMAMLFLDDGGVHNIDYPLYTNVFVDLELPGVGTTVNILEGASLRDLNGFGDSMINVSGGSIDIGLIAADRCQATISGGSMGELVGAFDSQVTVSGGSINGWLVAANNSQVIVSGGSMRALVADNSSQVTVSGGAIEEGLHTFDQSRVTVSGGLFAGGLLLWDNGVLTIEGSDFAVDGTPVGYIEFSSILGGNYWDEPDRRLTGTLLNGDPLDNYFYIGHDASIVLIPEPATLLLLGLGGLALLRRRG